MDLKTSWNSYLSMSRINKELLLKRAEDSFLNGDFSGSLREYGLILRDNPSLDDAKVGAYLSDLGIDSKEEAMALFDYYHAIKDKKENAVEIIDGLIESIDNTKSQLRELILDPIEEEIEYSDGIRYNDFLELVEERGDFKTTFEDIMFSTKVIITNKDEFIHFVKSLVNDGFMEMAVGYLESSSTLFGNDQDILSLYKLIENEDGQ